jgi:hypothetical protein
MPIKVYGEHGTQKRYAQHLRDHDSGADIDDACRAAHAAHIREYLSGARAKETHNREMRISRRAMARLRDEHPEQYMLLYLEEEIREMANDGEIGSTGNDA